jgi:hypothetical protein
MGGHEDVDSAVSALSTSAVYEIRGVQSNRCLDIAWGSSADGANVQIYDCLGSTAQQFKFEDMGSGFYRARNVNSNKCLDVSGWSSSNGGNIAQWSCGSGNNQQWSVSDVGGGKFKLVSRHSGKALDVANLATGNGSNVHQWSYGGGDNQKWMLNQIGGSSSSATSGGTSGGGGGSLPAECFEGQMIPMMNAELAVAMANDLRELTPTRDLQISNGRVEISGTGWGRCTNGCEHVQAVLSMQDDSVNNIIDQNVFNANSFRNNLVTQWNDQKTFENGNSQPMPSPHTLSPAGTADAYCGTDYKFQVTWNCSNCNKDAARIENRMRFFRPENSVIDFRVENGQVLIDPSGSYADGGGSGSGSCAEDTCSTFYRNASVGDCCTCNGKAGTFQKGASMFTLLCKTN